MSAIPRPIVDSVHPCPVCGHAMQVTFDALNRPRHRCPDCHGVVRTPIDGGTVDRVAQPVEGLALVHPSREQLNRLRQTTRPRYAPRLDTPTPSQPSARRCDRCGAVLPAQRLGRPRVRCEDTRACARRTKVAG